ncbi:MAG: hypothetical protein JNL80_10295 [Phycisphaerae bacterium]|jgi:hypothetical protein|nr:hypothetical protein [Phycisphaerae bacterium]
MPKAGGWLGLARYMLVSFIATFVAALLGTPLLVPMEDPGGWRVLDELLSGIFSGDAELIGVYAIIAAGIVLLQAIFLLPIYRPPAVAKRPRSFVKSVIMVSFLAALILALMAWASLELLTEKEAVEALENTPAYPFITLPIAVFFPSWVLWGRYLWRRSRAYDPVAIDRLMTPLLGSTAIGLGVLFPIDLFVRHRKGCFCATSSSWSLALGLASLLWLLGPFVVLLATRQQRQSLRRNLCFHCGHARSRGKGNARLRCQECGEPWTRRSQRRLRAQDKQPSSSPV